MCGGKAYDEESCMLACPMDCHMSAWSDWGICDTVCGSGLKNRTSKVAYYYQRVWPISLFLLNIIIKKSWIFYQLILWLYKQVLRLASTRGRPCPGPSVQYATCSYPCENYKWEASAWSECMLNNNRLTCGPGIRTRTTRYGFPIFPRFSYKLYVASTDYANLISMFLFAGV